MWNRSELGRLAPLDRPSYLVQQFRQMAIGYYPLALDGGGAFGAPSGLPFSRISKRL